MRDIYTVLGADEIKLTETDGRSHGAPGGGRPLRKRGFHRALKRGELWALLKQQTSSMLETLVRDMLFEKPHLHAYWNENISLMDGITTGKVEFINKGEIK